MILLHKKLSSSSHLLLKHLSTAPLPTTTTTTGPAATPFIVHYLINSCGFSADTALTASKRLSHLQSPSQPDSVIHFLKHLGFIDAQIQKLISKHPTLLCARVNDTLKPKFSALQQLGLSQSDIAHLLVQNPLILRAGDMQPKIEFWKSLFGSSDDLFKALRRSNHLLTCSLENTIIPNVSLLRECGIPDRRIAKMVLCHPRFVSRSNESMKALIERAEEMGVPRGSGMFSRMLQCVVCTSREALGAKLDLLRSLGWSEEEAMVAIRNAPMVAMLSEKMIRKKMEFFVRECGNQASEIARCPLLLAYSLDRRLIPRLHVVKRLKKKRLIDKRFSASNAMTLSEKRFLARFVLPHMEKVPRLYDTYVAAVSGGSRVPEVVRKMEVLKEGEIGVSRGRRDMVPPRLSQLKYKADTLHWPLQELAGNTMPLACTETGVS